MFKKFSAALLFSATSALCSAGIIDYGDTSFLSKSVCVYAETAARGVI
ncbi:MAG: hypothetical protein IKA32_12720 [Lentisphaeria bacterium]|nr:hypothetical protein [Lentisphaeria bacterium]